MRVCDPIYGSFTLPPFAEDLLLTPAARRLSSIRLLNFGPASLATLGELRRFSHTIGVVRLALANPFLGLSEGESKAVITALVLHDIGTPPYGHLFEYRLKARFGWSHEDVVKQLLSGSQSKETSAHPWGLGGRNQLSKILKRHNIDVDLLSAILEKKDPLSKFVFGSIDFDNLDNVARMNWAMGKRFDVSTIIDIARHLAIEPSGNVLLSENLVSAVDVWANLRRDAYETLVFDEQTVAGQAVLTKALNTALDAGDVVAEDWDYDDESLEALLARSRSAKEIVIRDMREGLPRLALLIRDAASLQTYAMKLGTELTLEVEQFLREYLQEKRPYGYAFVDRGAFSKRLDFVDPETRKAWSHGQTSESVILYGFSKASIPSGDGPELVGKKFEVWLRERAADAV